MKIPKGNLTKGDIYMKGICCQKCGRVRKGMVCEHCGYPYVYIRLKYKGVTYRFFHDKTGSSYTYSAADQARREMGQDIATGVFNPKAWTKQAVEERRFINSFETFLEQKRKKLKPATIYLYETYNRVHFTSLYDMDVREIQLKHLQKWYDTLPCLSSKYRKNMIDCLSTFFRWLLRWGNINQVPVMPEIQRAYSTPRTALTYDEQIEALKNIPEQHRPIYEFMMETGFRPGETCAIMIGDLNVSNRSILVQRGYSKGKLVESPKEGSRKWRILSKRAFEIAISSIESRLGDAFIFINPITDRGYSVEFLRKTWRLYSKSDVDLYSATRHSLATQLADDGISLIELQSIMGHADARSTQHYIHSAGERKRQYLDNRGKKIVELKAVK